MNSNVFRMAGIGLAIVMVLVAVIYISNRGSQIRLSGEIQRVRVLGLPDKASVVVVDFRFTNPADYPFIVREALVLVENTEGELIEGTAIAAVDAKTMFDYYSKADPELGPAYNEMFKARDRVEPGQHMDRMICARFEMDKAAVQAREKVRLRIEDVDGAITELEESRESK